MSGKFIGYETLGGFDNLAIVLEALAYHAFEGQVDIDDLATSSMLPKTTFTKRALKKVMEDFTQMGIVEFDDPNIVLQPLVSWEEGASGGRRQKLRAALIEAGIEADDLPTPGSLDETVRHRPVELEAPEAAPSRFDSAAAMTRRNEPVQAEPIESPEDESIQEPLSEIASEPPPAPQHVEASPAPENPNTSKRIKWGQKPELPNRSRGQVEVQPEAAAPNPPVSNIGPQTEDVPPPQEEPPSQANDRTLWGPPGNLPGKKKIPVQNAGASAPESKPSKTWDRGDGLPTKKRPKSEQPVPQPSPNRPSTNRIPPAVTSPASLPPRKPGASTGPDKQPTASPINRGGGRMGRPGVNMPVSGGGGSQSSMNDENVQELIARLLEDRDLATVDVNTAEAYAQAILEYIEKLKSAGLDTDPASGVRLSQLLAQLLTRLQGSTTDEE